MRLVITGAAGFIGSHFLELALKTNETEKIFEEIVVIDALTYASNKAYLDFLRSKFVFKFVKEDISNLSSMFSLIESKDHIINFAAESHVDNSLNNSLDFIKSNVLGTSVLLELSKSKKVQKFIQISTDEVYGTISEGQWDENSKVDPNSPYSSSKASADLIAMSFFRSHGIPVVITRSSNNYGPRQNGEKFVPKVILNILNSTEIPVYGNGENVRDWIYVEDNALAIWKLLMSGMPGQIYNIGGGTELSNLRLIEIIGLLMKTEPKVVFVEDRKAHDLRYSIATTKIFRELSYKPGINLESGLERTIEYYLKQNRK
jgi:dTDP-glucose 4,6-dehydratase